MKNTAALLMALGLALPAMTLAQDSDQPRPQRRERPAAREAGPGEPANVDRPGRAGQRPVVPPLMAALDANHDGVIDEAEIKNAAEALRKLDKNNDGKITREEIQPQRPGGPEGAVRGERNGPPTDGARPERGNQRQ